MSHGFSNGTHYYPGVTSLIASPDVSSTQAIRSVTASPPRTLQQKKQRQPHFDCGSIPVLQQIGLHNYTSVLVPSTVVGYNTNSISGE
jgi:hypothetical protein